MYFILYFIYYFFIGLFTPIINISFGFICCIALLVSFIIETIQKIRFFINDRLRRRKFYGS